jgi:hypothetical protein
VLVEELKQRLRLFVKYVEFCNLLKYIYGILGKCNQYGAITEKTWQLISVAMKTPKLVKSKFLM